MIPFPPQDLPISKSNLDESLSSQQQSNKFSEVLESPPRALADISSSFRNSPNYLSALVLTRNVGYTLTLFALVDLLYAVIPLKLADPIWEFQTIGDWFERVPVLMLGLVLIFYHGPDWRYKIEKYILRFSSWFSLAMAILFILIIPLCANDAIKINRLNNVEINIQLNEQALQLKQTRSRIQNASDAELSSLLLPNDGVSKITDAPQTTQDAKNLALEKVSNAEIESRGKANQARQNLKRNLLKNTIRLIIGCAVSVITFLIIWNNTTWARNFSSYRNAKILPASFQNNKKSASRGKKRSK